MGGIKNKAFSTHFEITDVMDKQKNTITPLLSPD